MQMLPCRGHGRIEALQMPGLHDAAILTAQLENTVSIGEARGQRLLNQQIDTRSQQRLRSGSMMHRRHTDRSSVERTHPRPTRLNRLESGNTELCRSLTRATKVQSHPPTKLTPP